MTCTRENILTPRYEISLQVVVSKFVSSKLYFRVTKESQEIISFPSHEVSHNADCVCERSQVRRAEGVCLQHDLNGIAAGKKKTETASVGFRTKFSSNGVTPLAPITPARPVTGLLTRSFPPLLLATYTYSKLNFTLTQY
jgi:hypothetical protein